MSALIFIDECCNRIVQLQYTFQMSNPEEKRMKLKLIGLKKKIVQFQRPCNAEDEVER